MQINPEHMPHFTQTAKKDFKKSKIVLVLAYFVTITYLFFVVPHLIHSSGTLLMFFVILSICPISALLVIFSERKIDYRRSKNLFISSILLLIGFIFLVVFLLSSWARVSVWEAFSSLLLNW